MRIEHTVWPGEGTSNCEDNDRDVEGEFPDVIAAPSHKLHAFRSNLNQWRHTRPWLDAPILCTLLNHVKGALVRELGHR